MDRRTFVCGTAAAAGIVPLRVRAQSRPTMARVAFLVSTPTPNETVFVQAMRDLGYEPGRNLSVERRSADGDFARLPALAAELVRSQPDVIAAFLTQASLAAKGATATIPIVMVAVSDPVASGSSPISRAPAATSPERWVWCPRSSASSSSSSANCARGPCALPPSGIPPTPSSSNSHSPRRAPVRIGCGWSSSSSPHVPCPRSMACSPRPRRAARCRAGAVGSFVRRQRGAPRRDLAAPSAAGSGRLSRVCGGGHGRQLRTRSGRVRAASCELRGPHPARCGAGRAGRRADFEVRARDQSQGRQGAFRRGAALVAAARDEVIQ